MFIPVWRGMRATSTPVDLVQPIRGRKWKYIETTQNMFLKIIRYVFYVREKTRVHSQCRWRLVAEFSPVFLHCSSIRGKSSVSFQFNSKRFCLEKPWDLFFLKHWYATNVKCINVSKRTDPTVIAIKSKLIKWFSSYFQKIFLTDGYKCIGSLKKENSNKGTLKKNPYFLKRNTSGFCLARWNNQLLTCIQ